MNRKDLFNAVNEIDDDVLERSERATISNVVPIRRRWPVALIAAILCLFLMGAGVVAVIYGDSIQNWFGHYFELVTGQNMSEGQTALIDHLSQDISQSKTIGETTVTVDSVTVGDDSFYLLLRVEGVELSNRYSYSFDGVTLEVFPDPLEEVDGIGSHGIQYQGMDGDGAALLLMDYSYATQEGFELDTTPLEVHLILENFMRSPQSDNRKMITEGVWEFNFTIDRSQPPATIALPDTEVMAMNLELREETPIILKNIELTNTGIRFQYDYQEGTYSMEAHLEVVLKNGATIGYSGGSGTPLGDGTTLNCSYQWMIPVNLDEVQAIRIGSVEIPVG